jgi:hypothetical protein
MKPIVSAFVYSLFSLQIMVIEVLQIGTLVALLIVPLFLPVKKGAGAIKLPKNYNDTSDARYAVNERGYLEEIHHDRLSNEA